MSNILLQSPEIKEKKEMQGFKIPWRNLFAVTLGAVGPQPSLPCGTATFHPHLSPQEGILTGARHTHRSPAYSRLASEVYPWPQHHRGMARLFCFIPTKLVSFSIKIIPTAVINCVLLRFTPFLFLWKSTPKQTISGFPNYFGMTITVWSGPDTLTVMPSITLTRSHF